jgi:hypothetical protein
MAADLCAVNVLAQMHHYASFGRILGLNRI